MKFGCAAALVLTTALARPLAAQEAVPRVFSPGVISGPADDLSPAFTPDGRTVYFTRANSTQSTILVSHRSGASWSTPIVAPFSGQWRDLEATMAPDGSYLIFASNRPVVPGGKPLDGHYNNSTQAEKGGNLWRVDRTARGWSAPRRLPEVINANTSVFSPSIAADGSLYFMQPSGAAGRFHIFRAARDGDGYAAPVPVSIAAGDSVGDYDPAVAPDQSFIVFSSARLRGKGGSLFISFQQLGRWTTPVYMGDTASAPNTNNIEPRLSPDARTLYFSSTRTVDTPAGDRAAVARGLVSMARWNNGLANIWQVDLRPWLTTGGGR